MTAEEYHHYHPYLAAAVGGVLAILVGMVADNYLGHLFVWGGSDCTRTGEMLACFGYPPTGIAIIAIVCIAAAVSVLARFEGAIRRLRS